VIDVTLLRADAVTLQLFAPEELETEILKSQTSEFQLGNERGLALTGKEVELYGAAKSSPGQERLEFVADKIMLASSL
jgi:hypothetical protein